jgi:hypothetical protein
MSLDNELRQAMRRVPAPEGFAERVRNVILSEAKDLRGEDPSSSARLRMTAPRWRAVAATLLLGTILGSWGVHQTIERRRGERARQQVLLALRIAGTQVARAQRVAHEAMTR